MNKIAIDANELLRLRLTAELAPELLARGVHPAALHDVVERAVKSGHFKLGVEGTLLDGGPGAIRDFVDDLKQSASFLFQIDERPAASDDRAARQSENDRIDAMSPLQKLEYANRLAMKKCAS